MKLFILIGTRPNFIKVTQFKKLAPQFDVEVRLIHTGQHFDVKMADVFFQELNFQPDYFLEIPQTNQVHQISNVLVGLEKLISKIGKPDLMIVPGDVNSTLAGALFANEMGIKLAHLESGLRSNDREMPEEHNRVLTDHLSDFLFVTEQSGLDTVERENIKGKPYLVGNTMIDTMVAFEKQIESSTILERLAVDKPFIPVTIHRPSNVDNIEGLEKLLALFQVLSSKYQLLFPIHPRTKKKMEEFGLTQQFNEINGLKFLEPLGYFDFQKLVKSAALVLTDSGGIQEETTFRQVPCITLRQNTERPSTCEIGTNTLMDFEVEPILNIIKTIENGTYKKGQIPTLWDGLATKRILEIISKL